MFKKLSSVGSLVPINYWQSILILSNNHLSFNKYYSTYFGHTRIMKRKKFVVLIINQKNNKKTTRIYTETCSNGTCKSKICVFNIGFTLNDFNNYVYDLVCLKPEYTKPEISSSNSGVKSNKVDKYTLEYISTNVLVENLRNRLIE